MRRVKKEENRKQQTIITATKLHHMSIRQYDEYEIVQERKRKEAVRWRQKKRSGKRRRDR